MPHSQKPVSERKKLLLKLGLASFLVLLLVFCALNLKNAFHFNAKEADRSESFDWGKIMDDFNATFSQVNKDFKSAKQKQVAQAAAPVLDKLVSEVNLKNKDVQVPAITGLPTSEPVNVLENISASTSLELLENKINATKKK